ncbi:MAG TPA: hypothetical protein VNZ57_00495, partial [Longimicrobiales bacterium]|nr:hypothetical protein [Longimicrobiales bacterium]
LVIWEAQFGDFANAAQVIIDQFVAAGRAKWGQRSRLALLLPHGYEGQGPEHSSARVERFLQLAGEDNVFVVNCTTPAQYFHVLRRQARMKSPRPLVAITPKSLLRHPRAVSSVSALVDSTFHPVLDDATAAARADEVSRLIFCTGKVYYDLVDGAQGENARQIAIARIEELYPFPADHVAEVVKRYPGLREVLWVQEEPKNMGAWCYVESRLRAAMGDGVPLRYVGRPERASPAEGYANVHERQQRELVEAALSIRPGTPRARKAKAG